MMHTRPDKRAHLFTEVLADVRALRQDLLLLLRLLLQVRHIVV